MLAVLAASALPLSVYALAALLLEKQRQETLTDYTGGLLHALTCAVYGMGGQQLDIPTPAQMREKLWGEEAAESGEEATVQAAFDGIFQFLREGGNEDEAI